MDILKDGVEWLADVMSANASTTIHYTRGNAAYTIPAVMTNTRYEMSDDYGSIVGSFRVDFLIESENLPFDPQPGDSIICPNASGVYSITYEVMEIAGEGCWRWSDPHGSVRRIHAKRI